MFSLDVSVADIRQTITEFTNSLIKVFLFIIEGIWVSQRSLSKGLVT